MGWFLSLRSGTAEWQRCVLHRSPSVVLTPERIRGLSKAGTTISGLMAEAEELLGRCSIRGYLYSVAGRQAP